MSYMIIGVHGLSNKRRANTLADWWQLSMLKGLKKNQGVQTDSLNFTSVYWEG